MKAMSVVGFAVVVTCVLHVELAWADGKDSEGLPARSRYGWAELKEEDLQGQVERWAQVIRDNPTNSPAYYNIGVILCGTGKEMLAVQYFLQAVKVDPQNIEALWQAAEIYRRASCVRETEALYSRLVKVTGHGEREVLALVQLYVEREMLVSAARVIDEARRMGRESVELDSEAAYLMLLAGKSKQAEAAYGEIIRSNRGHAMAHAGLAASILAGDSARALEARKLAEQAVELSGRRCPRSFYVLALCCSSEGDGAGAEEAWMNVLRIVPTHCGAWQNLGAAALGGGDIGRARECFRRVLEQRPHKLDAQFNLVRALVASSRTYAEGVRMLGGLARQAKSGNRAAVKGALLLKHLAARGRETR